MAHVKPQALAKAPGKPREPSTFGLEPKGSESRHWPAQKKLYCIKWCVCGRKAATISTSKKLRHAKTAFCTCDLSNSFLLLLWTKFCILRICHLTRSSHFAGRDFGPEMRCSLKLECVVGATERPSVEEWRWLAKKGMVQSSTYTTSTSVPKKHSQSLAFGPYLCCWLSVIQSIPYWLHLIPLSKCTAGFKSHKYPGRSSGPENREIDASNCKIDKL